MALCTYQHRKLGNDQEAINYYQKSLAIFGAIDDHVGISLTSMKLKFLNINWAEYQKPMTSSELQEEINFTEQWLADSQTMGENFAEAVVLSRLGFLYSKQNNFDEAEQSLLNSLNIYESLNSKELEDNHKISFFDTYISAYTILQKVFIQQNKINQALEIAERGRARAFIELLLVQVYQVCWYHYGV